MKKVELYTVGAFEATHLRWDFRPGDMVIVFELSFREGSLVCCPFTRNCPGILGILVFLEGTTWKIWCARAATRNDKPGDMRASTIDDFDWEESQLAEYMKDGLIDIVAR